MLSMVLANAEGHLAMKCVVRRNVLVVLLIVAGKLVTCGGAATQMRAVHGRCSVHPM